MNCLICYQEKQLIKPTTCEHSFCKYWLYDIYIENVLHYTLKILLIMEVFIKLHVLLVKQNIMH